MTNILLTIVKLALKSGLRGRTRFAILMAKIFPQLRSFPIKMSNGNKLFLDLRLVISHDLITGRAVEEEEQKVMRKFVKDGMIVYDIGVFVGLHLVFLSSLIGKTGRVFAFEPQPHLFKLLQKTISQLPNAELFPYALSDKTGKTSFFVAKEHSMSSLSDWTGKGTRIEVETARLDDLVKREKIPLPDFIKCDVEGAEILCFRGGQETIEKACPILIFESLSEAAANIGSSQRDVITFLKDLKKTIIRFFEIQKNADLVEIFEPRAAYANILALPQSRFSLSEMGQFTVKS